MLCIYVSFSTLCSCYFTMLCCSSGSMDPHLPMGRGLSDKKFLF